MGVNSLIVTKEPRIIRPPEAGGGGVRPVFRGTDNRQEGRMPIRTDITGKGYDAMSSVYYFCKNISTKIYSYDLIMTTALNICGMKSETAGELISRSKLTDGNFF